ncbi:MAG: lamin tail domain-containing protein, partial [Verrucomicrobia bacterium]
MFRLLSRFLPSLVPAAIVALSPALADSTVVFNEIMYRPAANQSALEWVELHNQMGVNMDISGWSLAGPAQFRFAEGTVVPGRGYIVVALSPEALAGASGYSNAFGPYLGRLSGSGARLELRNNNQRLMDWVEYRAEGDWPVGPDGGGVSLAKRVPDAASPPATNWTSSAQIGGTPGAPNFTRLEATTATVLVRLDSIWKYNDSGTDPGVSWRETNFYDQFWPTGAALFYTGAAVPPAGDREAISTLFDSGVDDAHKALVPGAADPHYLLTVSAQGTPPPPSIAATVIQNHPAWLANDALSSWIGPVNPGTSDVAPGEYRYRTTFSLSGFDPSTAQVVLKVAADNRVNNLLLNGAGRAISFAGYADFSPNFSIGDGFVTGANTLEFVTANDSTSPNPAGFRVKLTGTAQSIPPRNTQINPLPPVTYFRAAFTFQANPAATSLKLRALIDDGAVFYLNGAEVLRLNMPGGAIDSSTPASLDITNVIWSGPFSLPASSLRLGANVLGVEVHQSPRGTNDLLFGAELLALPAPPERPPLAFNELTAASDSPFWLELANVDTNDLALDGFVLAADGAVESQFVFPAGSRIKAGGFLSLDETRLSFHPQSGDRLFLYSPSRRSLVDAVVVKKTLRGRYPDGTGQWLYPAAPTPGNPNQFAFHDEIVLNEILYHPRESTNGSSPVAWVELFNRSATAVDLAGWQLDKGIDFTFPAGTIMAPGSYLVVAADTNYLRALYPGIPITGNFANRLSHRSDLIALKDANKNPVNEVRYYDDGRWPANADGGGSSLELRNPFADNTQAEAWAASDESTKSRWQTYAYRGVATLDGGPTLWNEFVLGLLDSGEVLLDDISVIESPDTAPRELLQNGLFENGATAWRIIGNHRGEIMVDPDDPANHVLHLIATGPTEHMHNHAETTLADGAAIVNGREYKIAFRAKWLAGSNQMHTRLYFNRLARVTPLEVPDLTGTPGARNSRFETNIGPTFSEFQHRPVVPAANEPVTVSVTVHDPDGVAA